MSDAKKLHEKQVTTKVQINFTRASCFWVAKSNKMDNICKPRNFRNNLVGTLDVKVVSIWASKLQIEMNRALRCNAVQELDDDTMPAQIRASGLRWFQVCHALMCYKSCTWTMEKPMLAKSFDVS